MCLFLEFFSSSLSLSFSPPRRFLFLPLSASFSPEVECRIISWKWGATSVSILHLRNNCCISTGAFSSKENHRIFIIKVNCPEKNQEWSGIDLCWINQSSRPADSVAPPLSIALLSNSSILNIRSFLKRYDLAMLCTITIWVIWKRK